MDDEQERHEQLMYRLDQIERRVLPADTLKLPKAMEPPRGRGTIDC
jgi:hypothetical protein